METANSRRLGYQDVNDFEDFIEETNEAAEEEQSGIKYNPSKDQPYTL